MLYPLCESCTLHIAVFLTHLITPRNIFTLRFWTSSLQPGSLSSHTAPKLNLLFQHKQVEMVETDYQVIWEAPSTCSCFVYYIPGRLLWHGRQVETPSWMSKQSARKIVDNVTTKVIGASQIIFNARVEMSWLLSCTLLWTCTVTFIRIFCLY